MGCLSYDLSYEFAHFWLISVALQSLVPHTALPHGRRHMHLWLIPAYALQQRLNVNLLLASLDAPWTGASVVASLLCCHGRQVCLQHGSHAWAGLASHSQHCWPSSVTWSSCLPKNMPCERAADNTKPQMGRAATWDQQTTFTPSSHQTCCRMLLLRSLAAAATSASRWHTLCRRAIRSVPYQEEEEARKVRGGTRHQLRHAQLTAGLCRTASNVSQMKRD
jgi:hypothetical protein